MVNLGLLINPYRFSTAFSPSDISGLHAWYDASDLASITKDGSDRVSQWNDKSGNAYHLAQATGGNQPLWVDAAQNGLAVIRTDGSRFMNYDWATLAQPFTVICCSELPNSNSRIIISGQAPDDIYVWHKSGNANEWRVNAGTEVNFTDAGLLGADAYATLIFNGASSAFRVNGVSKSTSNPGSGGLTGLTISRNGNSGGTAFFGELDYFEIIIYNKALNSTEYGQVESYLASKWGI